MNNKKKYEELAEDIRVLVNKACDDDVGFILITAEKDGLHQLSNIHPDIADSMMEDLLFEKHIPNVPEKLNG